MSSASVDLGATSGNTGGVLSLNGLTGALTLVAGTDISITPVGNTITISSTGFSGILPVANGGTGASTPVGARANLGAAASGANSDITSLSGLTTPLSVLQGGSGATTANAAFNALSPLTTLGDLLYFTTVNARLPVGSNGQFLTVVAGAPAWSTVVTGGTVTSVALTMPSIFSVAGSPITSSGTLAVTLATETANTVFAGPTTGGAAIPTFRALVAADIPLISLTTGVSGVLPIANGGTNASTAATARTSLGAAASGANSDITSLSGLTTPLSVAQGGTGQSTYTDGQLLIGNTTGNTLTKTTLTAGSGITITNGSGSITLATTGLAATTTKTANYTILSTDSIIFCDTTGGAFTLTLPSPTALAGKVYRIIDTGGAFQTNNLTLARSAAESIEGLAASKVLQTNWGYFEVTTNGTNWFVG